MSSSWIIPVSTDFPELEYVKELLYWDGPLTCLFKSASGQRYVLHWGEPLDGEGRASGDRYLLLLIPDAPLDAWLETGCDIQISWRPTFVQATRFAFVDLSPDGKTIVTEVNFDAANEYLPTETE